MALKAFTRVHLAAGEERQLTFVLNGRDLAILDEQMRWVLPESATTLLIGASSKDIRLRGELASVRYRDSKRTVRSSR